MHRSKEAFYTKVEKHLFSKKKKKTCQIPLDFVMSLLLQFVEITHTSRGLRIH